MWTMNIEQSNYGCSRLLFLSHETDVLRIRMTSNLLYLRKYSLWPQCNYYYYRHRHQPSSSESIGWIVHTRKQFACQSQLR